jgi:hypothetical protein
VADVSRSELALASLKISQADIKLVAQVTPSRLYSCDCQVPRVTRVTMVLLLVLCAGTGHASR